MSNYDIEFAARYDRLEEDLDLLKEKLAKLKALVLLADPAVSHLVMERMNLTIWGEYCKAFPEEGNHERSSENHQVPSPTV